MTRADKSIIDRYIFMAGAAPELLLRPEADLIAEVLALRLDLSMAQPSNIEVAFLRKDIEDWKARAVCAENELALLRTKCHD